MTNEPDPSPVGLTVAAFAAVAIGGFTPRTALTATIPRVHTDMDDCPPGATVYITGGGFLANEMVQLEVLHVGVDGEYAQDPTLDTPVAVPARSGRKEETQ